jgi:hypothetical protein
MANLSAKLARRASMSRVQRLPRLHLAMQVGLALLAPVLALSPMAHAERALLAPVSDTDTAQVASQPSLTGMAIRLDAEAFDAPLGTAMSLTLPDGLPRKLVITDVRQTAYGETLVGAFAQTPKANRVLITRSGDIAFGRVQDAGKTWLIEPAVGGGLVMFDEAERGQEISLADDQVIPNIDDIKQMAWVRPAKSFSPLMQPIASDDRTVDIAVFYTQGYAELHGLGTAARVNFLFELLQQGLADSDTQMFASLVHMQQVTYSDTATFSTALTDLRAGNSTADGDLSAVRGIANAKGADLIQLLRRFRSSTNSCGLAYLISGNQNNYVASSSFNVGVSADGTDNGFLCSLETFAHEVGHNLGLGHDNKNTSSPCDSDTPKDGRGNGVMPYSCGFNSNGLPGATAYRTIMAYNVASEQRQSKFSNPQIFTCGNGNEICGAVETDPNPADNARSLREQGVKAAGLRARVPQLVSAVLPTGRSVGATGIASAFATMINSGSDAATGCRPVIAGLDASRFSFQTTNAQNQLIGMPNTSVNVAAGAAQSFVFGITANGDQAPVDVMVDFQCANRRAATPISGLNTFLFGSSTTPVFDILTIGATPSADGVLRLGGVGVAGAFATAAVNIATATGTVRIEPSFTGTVAGVTLTVCDTTGRADGTCAAAPTAQLTRSLASNSPITFAVFATATNAVAFEPARNRIRISLRDSANAERGGTSVALTTQ